MINPLPLLVAEAFLNAFENGYDLSIWSPLSNEEIAEDMMEYDADIAEYPFEEVLKYVTLQRKE